MSFPEIAGQGFTRLGFQHDREVHARVIRDARAGRSAHPLQLDVRNRDGDREGGLSIGVALDHDVGGEEGGSAAPERGNAGLGGQGRRGQDEQAERNERQPSR